MQLKLSKYFIRTIVNSWFIKKSFQTVAQKFLIVLVIYGKSWNIWKFIRLWGSAQKPLCYKVSQCSSLKKIEVTLTF